MASKYGKGYYTDWYEMIVAIQEGSKKAFKKACQKICDECNERIRGGIYTQGNISGTYERTMEMANMDYLKAEVHGTECQFLFDNQEFMELTIDNPEHHGLSDEGANANYDTVKFMEEIISPIHNDFMVDIHDYIYNNFADIYRQCCKEEGFTL